jgi:hypothetical protein
MLDKKMEQLSSFINEIEQMDPIEFIKKYGYEIFPIHSLNDDDMVRKISKFNEDLDTLINANKDISEELLIQQMFYNVLFMLKKKIIYKQATSLGIQPSLYKKEMRFLFKGIK